MAIFQPSESFAGPVDYRWLFPWTNGSAITSITGGGTSATVLGTGDAGLVYGDGVGLAYSGANPTAGSFGLITLTGIFTLDLGGVSAAFADIDGFDAERILDGDDSVDGTASAGDYLFAGFGGTDVLDGKGGGDGFLVTERPNGAFSLTIKGATDADDTLFIMANKYDPSAVFLDLRSSTLISIDFITLIGGTGVTIHSSQLGAGIAKNAEIGATSGEGAFDIVKDTEGGTLDVSSLMVNPDTTFKIFGNASAETIIGGEGDEAIAGGGGADRLTGGEGSSVFRYFDVADSGRKKALRDTITDFRAKGDILSLSDIDANANKDENQAFKFRAKEGKALKKAGDLVFEQIDKSGTAKDMTVVYGDVNGDAKADMAIQLKGLVDLKATDFFL